jgi:hypothetical protein
LGIAQDLDDLGTGLQILEQLGRFGPHLVIRDLLPDLLFDGGHVLGRDERPRDVLLALENQVLVADWNDRRDLAFLQAVRDLLDVGIAHMLADRGDHAVDAGGRPVLGVFLGQLRKTVRIALRRFPQPIGFLPVADRDHARLDLRPVLGFERLAELLVVTAT